MIGVGTAEVLGVRLAEAAKSPHLRLARGRAQLVLARGLDVLETWYLPRDYMDHSDRSRHQAQALGATDAATAAAKVMAAAKRMVADRLRSRS